MRSNFTGSEIGSEPAVNLLAADALATILA
jgi:hypothetical protein